ncbi:hypothetical protein VN12_02120 [Pirellula sp. SH-Sr6A]|uniref:hypothetical protein n=1 Tax=Pirellula sp. SH-Sr6A TaxID=1632865 RepID=UPI00078BF473|nr:hypothetical protein [Pirellula sp. SH-Sr6A]AMV30882.1 hypothetical protein VN12_02120 [Pirellula sp. SH-Sr6A]
MKKVEHWGCDVRINGKHVLTIESNCVYGRFLTDADEETIREIAENLLAFVGKKKTSAAQSAEGE